MDPTGERLSRLARTMDDINQLELEEMARGAAPRQVLDENRLHLNVLKRRIQQQRGIVSKLSRDDLENQYLHALEELEILKKEGNTKDIYIKKLSTKILRLQQSEHIHREDLRSFSPSLRTELEQKIRGLENQLRMTKVYGSSLPRRGSKTEPTVNRSQIDSLRQQIQMLESEKRDEQEAHRRTERDMQAEIARVTEKIANENARTTMLENIEITRLTRQLAKTSQDLLNMKNDYIDIRPKYEELQINKIVVTRENERLKQEIERHQQTIDSIERQLREARERSLQQIHDHERANRLESELEWLKRQPQTLRPESVTDQAGRPTESVLRSQIKSLEEEMQKDARECHELRKRVTEREMDIEKALRDISELRAVNLHLKQECDDFRTKYEAAVRAEPKKAEGWFQAPPGMRDEEISEALRLHEAFRNRRSMGISTENSAPSEVVVYRSDPILLDELEHSRSEREEIKKDLSSARDRLRKAEDEVERLQHDRSQLSRELEDTRSNLRGEVGATSQAAANEIKELKRVIQDKSHQLTQQIRLVEDLEQQLKDIADGVVVYNLEEEVADQSRLSAENVVLQRGENLLQIHFGPFSFNEEFFQQAQALRIKKWRLKWSVFGENMFAQDSDQTRPDFDFTAIHCITMDEEIMHDLAEGNIRLEIVGIRNDFSRAFTFATFSCRKLLEDSFQRLNRVRGEVSLISQFNVGVEFGTMAYWIRMKFDIRQTQAMFLARKKALDYVDENTENRNGRPTANQVWMRETGRNANLLHIRIIGCRGVRALSGRAPPNPCILYQFFNAKMTYTPAVTGTENPNFDHLTTFRVVMDDQALRSYLQSKKLDLYVTDANDHNKDHFLGYCKIALAELLQDSMPEKQTLPLFTQDNRQNGTITLSIAWERPFGLDSAEISRSTNHAPYAVSNGRGNRVSNTPRGSLVSVRHTAKLMTVDTPVANGGGIRETSRKNTIDDVRDGESIEQRSREAESRPRPPPRKSISGPSRNESSPITNGQASPSSRKSTNGRMANGDADGATQRKRSSDLPGDQSLPESPLSTRRRRSCTVDERRSQPDVEAREYRSVERHDSARAPSRMSVQDPASSQPRSPRKSDRNDRSSPATGRRAPLHRNLSENGDSSFLRKLAGFDIGEKARRATVADPSVPPAMRQTVEVEMHPTGSPKEKRVTPFRSFLNGFGRKNSQNLDKNKNGDGKLNSPSGSNSTPRDILPANNIRIAVHSLYFVENARILGDLRPGEIFVIFELMGAEHESPLAVIKPTVPNKVLTFEFEKFFSVDSERNAEQRRMLGDMLEKVPPARIPFSVYFQPDDESMDSELVGVAALSLNRLLTKNQDALGAELKLVNPTESGLTVGYMKVTVQAVSVLTEIQSERSRTY